MLTCEPYNRRVRDLTAFGVLVVVTAMASALVTTVQKHAVNPGTPPVYRASKVGQVRTLSLLPQTPTDPANRAEGDYKAAVL